MLDLVQRFASPADVARAVSVLMGVSAAVTFAEKLVRAHDFGPGGWFPWRIFRFDRLQVATVRRLPRFFDALFGFSGMSLMLVAGLLGVGVMWLAPISTWRFTAGVATVVAVILLLHVRSTYGGDGSQQMNLLVGSALLLGFNPIVRPAAGVVSLLFIAAQSCLAYATSGLAKVASPIWMRGDPLVGIFATTAYGSPLGLRLVSVHSAMRRAVCLGMVFTETIFPLAVVAPEPVLVAFLAWGVLFHLSNAVLMGLNTFFWSFLATYPALIYVWHVLHAT